MTPFQRTKTRFLDLTPCMQSGGIHHIYQCYQLKQNEIMLQSGCVWFGNLSIDKLYTRIVKTQPLEK